MIKLILKYCIQLFCYNLQNSGAKYARNKMLRRKLQIYEVTASYKSARIKATAILIKAISLYDQVNKFCKFYPYSIQANSSSDTGTEKMKLSYSSYTLM